VGREEDIATMGSGEVTIRNEHRTDKSETFTVSWNVTPSAFCNLKMEAITWSQNFAFPAPKSTISQPEGCSHTSIYRR
jgi:hypothetical protein